MSLVNFPDSVENSAYIFLKSSTAESAPLPREVLVDRCKKNTQLLRLVLSSGGISTDPTFVQLRNHPTLSTFLVSVVTAVIKSASLQQEEMLTREILPLVLKYSSSEVALRILNVFVENTNLSPKVNELICLSTLRGALYKYFSSKQMDILGNLSSCQKVEILPQKAIEIILNADSRLLEIFFSRFNPHLDDFLYALLSSIVCEMDRFVEAKSVVSVIISKCQLSRMQNMISALIYVCFQSVDILHNTFKPIISIMREKYPSEFKSAIATLENIDSIIPVIKEYQERFSKEIGVLTLSEFVNESELLGGISEQISALYKVVESQQEDLSREEWHCAHDWLLNILQQCSKSSFVQTESIFDILVKFRDHFSKNDVDISSFSKILVDSLALPIPVSVPLFSNLVALLRSFCLQFPSNAIHFESYALFHFVFLENTPVQSMALFFKLFDHGIFSSLDDSSSKRSTVLKVVRKNISKLETSVRMQILEILTNLLVENVDSLKSDSSSILHGFMSDVYSDIILQEPHLDDKKLKVAISLLELGIIPVINSLCSKSLAIEEVEYSLKLRLIGCLEKNAKSILVLKASELSDVGDLFSNLKINWDIIKHFPSHEGLLLFSTISSSRMHEFIQDFESSLHLFALLINPEKSIRTTAVNIIENCYRNATGFLSKRLAFYLLHHKEDIALNHKYVESSSFEFDTEINNALIKFISDAKKFELCSEKVQHFVLTLLCSSSSLTSSDIDLMLGLHSEARFSFHKEVLAGLIIKNLQKISISENLIAFVSLCFSTKNSSYFPIQVLQVLLDRSDLNQQERILSSIALYSGYDLNLVHVFENLNISLSAITQSLNSPYVQIIAGLLPSKPISTIVGANASFLLQIFDIIKDSLVAAGSLLRFVENYLELHSIRSFLKRSSTGTPFRPEIISQWMEVIESYIEKDISLFYVGLGVMLRIHYMTHGVSQEFDITMSYISRTIENMMQAIFDFKIRFSESELSSLLSLVISSLNSDENDLKCLMLILTRSILKRSLSNPELAASVGCCVFRAFPSSFVKILILNLEAEPHAKVASMIIEKFSTSIIVDSFTESVIQLNSTKRKNMSDAEVVSNFSSSSIVEFITRYLQSLSANTPKPVEEDSKSIESFLMEILRAQSALPSFIFTSLLSSIQKLLSLDNFLQVLAQAAINVSTVEMSKSILFSIQFRLSLIHLKASASKTTANAMNEGLLSLLKLSVSHGSSFISRNLEVCSLWFSRVSNSHENSAISLIKFIYSDTVMKSIMEVREILIKCLSAACENIKIKFLQFLAPSMTLAFESINEEPEASFDFMLILLTCLPKFFSSYTSKILEAVSTFLSTCENPALYEKSWNVLLTLSNAVEFTELVPAVYKAMPTALEQDSHKPSVALLTLLSDVCKKHEPKSDIGMKSDALFSFLLRVFDVRFKLFEDDRHIDVNEIENTAADTFVSIALFLKGGQLKVVFQKLIQWVGVEFSSLLCQTRCLVLFKIVKRFLEILQDVFLPYLSIIMEFFSAVLPMNVHKGSLGTKNHMLIGTLRYHTISVLVAAFKLSSSKDFLQSSVFLKLMPLLVGQISDIPLFLECVPELEFGSVVDECIVELASAIGDDAHWKPLTNEILRLMTSSSSKIVRVSSLRILRHLFDKLQEPYLECLPEIIASVSEVMEDESNEVILECKSLIRCIETLAGESVEQYLR